MNERVPSKAEILEAIYSSLDDIHKIPYKSCANRKHEIDLVAGLDLLLETSALHGSEIIKAVTYIIRAIGESYVIGTLQEKDDK